MYERITGEDPYKVPMRIYPAVHYVMGGLWVDYELQSTIPGCFRRRRGQLLRSRRQPAGRLRADAGLADGYFVLPYTVPNYLLTSALAKRRVQSTIRFQAGRG